MKNKLTAILALLLAAVMLAGCTAHVENQDNDKDNENIDISVKVTPTVEPTVEPTPQIMKMTLFTDMVEEYGSREKADEALYYNKNEDWVSIDKKSDYKIPVYGYDDILFLDYKNKTNNEDIIAGWDNFAVKLTANHSIEVTAHFGNPWRLTLLTFFLPGGALRENPAHTDNPYIMYDTDKGYRIYFFFGKSMRGIGESFRVGTAAIMLEKVSFEAYKPLLKEGVDIDTLIEADPAMKAWSDHLYGPLSAWMTKGGKTVNEALEIIGKKNGQRLTSAVILTDGMLFITWDYVDGKFVVDTYEYREDFIYDAYGIQVCYKINEEDYVG